MSQTGKGVVRRLGRIVFLLLDAVLLVFFLVGYAARYVHPRVFWWGELVAIVLPYLSLLLLAATVVVARHRRWRLLAVHLVLLLLAVVRFVPVDRLLQAPRPGTEGLTVMTYNLPSQVGEGSDEEVRQMAALVRSQAPGLLALQEASLGHRPRAGVLGARYLTNLVDSLGYQLPEPEVRRRTKTQQPVLSRFEQTEQTETVFGVGPDDVDETRVVRVQFTWQGRDVVLYNLHLRTYGPLRPWQAERIPPFDPSFWIPYLRQYRRAYLVRAREAEQIRRMLEQETLPIILCGDFNSTPHNWVYRHLAGGLGLQDAFRQAGKGWGATYHARLPLVRIDFVLVSPEWEVVSARVPAARLSDHRPLVVHLRWREE